jgi:integrase
MHGRKLITSLRAFLRYLAVQGLCRADLDKTVPAYASWRLAELPRYLTAAQVNDLIAACDGDVPGRRRDRAILLLLARLGLRAGDVAQLRFGDIEWETGSLRVCGSAGNPAMKFVFRFRKGSGTRSSPISNAGLPPVTAIRSSFATSPLTGHS